MSALKLLFMPALAAVSLALGVAVFAAPGVISPGFVQVPGLQPLQGEGQMLRPTPGLTTQNFRVQSQEQEVKDDVTHEHNQVAQEVTPGGPTRVSATNPDGKEVHLPCVSDVVRHPEKHPEWQAPQGQGCQPGAYPGVTVGGEGGHGNNASIHGAPQRATMTNPSRKCVRLPATVAAAQSRERHPRWAEGCNSGRGSEGG
jgi:hypothetical protein